MIWKGVDSMKNDTIKLLTRTVLYLLVVINCLLGALGKAPVQFNENNVLQFVSCIVQTGVLIYGFWKNNSFTKEAKIADKLIYILKQACLNSQELREYEEKIERKGE